MADLPGERSAPVGPVQSPPVRRAEVSALAPWQYARIAFALALDVAMFDRWPGLWALAGCSLIAAGGLVLAWPARK